MFGSIVAIGAIEAAAGAAALEFYEVGSGVRHNQAALEFIRHRKAIGAYLV